MLNEFSRTELLLGEEAMAKLKSSSVAVFGVGGVGSYVVEALARSGIGTLALIDNDDVSLTNINRQLVAMYSTVGRLKVDVAKEHILDVNPKCSVQAFPCFYTEEDNGGINLSDYDYIVDAIDTVSSKLFLIEQAKELDIPIISCMGAGNKLDPSKFQITDIYKTSMCPLAKVMRYELKRRGIKKLKVLFSTEQSVIPKGSSEENSPKRQIPGSIAFVPSVAGLMIAGEVIRDLIKI